ncbi:MAG TPA: GntR family transcriptional regulator, partial [Franconibacter helveticus]|nr:GntR family transcriptional regulator [Franconibacter helveticus]
EVDLTRHAEELQRLRIHLAPGSLFSASCKYANCLRLTYALPYWPRRAEALRTMG